jgi:hypothetical protein
MTPEKLLTGAVESCNNTAEPNWVIPFALLAFAAVCCILSLEIEFNDDPTFTGWNR